ncbi:MAG: MFS transporter [Candidatus Zipacnadales bacterium]
MILSSQLGALVLGHFMTDCYMGMVLPLMPIIRERLDLSLAQVMLVPVCTSLTASLAQPLLGLLSDVTRRSYLITIGVALTAIGICTFGAAKSFWVMLLLLSLGGLGCGAFHPAGAALASAVGGERRDFTLGLFSPGGIVGYSIGPVIGMWLYQQRGIDGMWPGMLAGLMVAPFLGVAASNLERQTPTVVSPAQAPRDRNGITLSRRRRLALLTVLTTVVFLQSTVVTMFCSSLALLLETRGVPEVRWGRTLMLFVFAGGIAGILGAQLASLLGRRWLTVLTLALASPTLYGFLHTGDFVSTALLAVGGALTQASVPVNIVQAQLLLPRHPSLASAIMMGFCWGVASFLTPLFGHLATLSSLTITLSSVSLIPLLASVLAIFLPESGGPPSRPTISEPPLLSSPGFLSMDEQ